jgi:AraC-like DNA-binding protein
MPELPQTAQTADLPRGQRFDFWRNIVSQTFVPLDVTAPCEAGGFRGRLRGADLGMLRMYEVDAEPHIAHRTSRLIAATPAGSYKVGLQLSGSSVLSQGGRETPLRAGEFAVYDTDRPYRLAFGEPHRMLVLVFPHAMLGLPAERVARLTATRMSGREGMGALIAPFLVRVAGVLDDLDSRGGVRLAGNVLDLITTVLAERLDAVPADPRTAHRSLLVQITAFIEQHLGDIDLSPDLIAAAHHISTRLLHKLFHAQGTTVSAWIRQRRLEHCRHDLRDPLQQSRLVSAIGARWGYPDAAHFSRLFKATFGMSPRDYRMAAAPGSSVLPPVPGAASPAAEPPRPL